MTRILLAMIAVYRRWLSPALHTLGAGGCKFMPTCSEYASIAIAMHGPLRGSGLALWRLLRCHPFSRGGFDPPPAAATTHAHLATESCAPRATSFPHEPLP